MMKCLFLIILLLISSTFAKSETIEILTLDYPPYISNSLPDMGPHAELMKKSFEITGYEINITFYPWNRAYEMAKNGKGYLISASKTSERELLFYYSEAYDRNDTYLIGLNNQFTVSSGLSELVDKKVSIIRGHYAIEILTEKGFSNIYPASNDEVVISRLLNNRVDLIVIGRNNLLSIILSDENYKTQSNNFIIIEPPLKENPMFLIGSKSIPDALSVIEAFNYGLNKLKESGEYSQIMRKHGLE